MATFGTLSPTFSPAEVTVTINTTQEECHNYTQLMGTWFYFGTQQLVRVLVTWLLFVISLVGNIFIIWVLSKSKASHLIMFHLALSNIVFTTFVMPMDAIWNTTMFWIAGEALCRITQMMKQFGMYASSFLVVVIAIDRVTAILSPISYEDQKKRGVTMVIMAWCCSVCCCIPAGVIFSLKPVLTCDGRLFHQCVDFLVIRDSKDRAPYYFFTMFISFILPLTTTLVSYSLIVCEISNMKQRDQALMGRRDSFHAASMDRARKRTILMRLLITMTFIICWAPYYGKGIYDWFKPDAHRPPTAMDSMMYAMMYLNPCLHPLVFGIFMKEIRTRFHTVIQRFPNSIFNKKKQSKVSSSQELCNSAATATIYHPYSQSPTKRSIPVNGDESVTPFKKNMMSLRSDF